MVFPWPLAARIRQLGAEAAVELVRAVGVFEAERLDLPLAVVEMTLRVYDPDAGIDGLTHFPGDTVTIIPTGDRVWQIKTGNEAPSAVEELAKSGVVDRVGKGFGYVLVWTKDATTAQRDTVRLAFTTGVAALHKDAPIEFIFNEDLERLARRYPSVAMEVLGAPLGRLVDIAALQYEHRTPFITDDARQRLIGLIRDHVKSTSPDNFALHLFGEVGVGATRVVYESLRAEDYRDRALVARGPDDVDPEILRWITSSSSLAAFTLVVDGCTAADEQRLKGYASEASGRIRLITISHRDNRSAIEDATHIELRPLESSAIEKLLHPDGRLPLGASQIIVDLAQGYPRLALRLADAISAAQPGSPLLDLTRRREIADVLGDMLPDADRRELLGYLALFERVGYEGSVESELTELSTVFGLDADALRHACDEEDSKLVRRAGRYRHVTPKALTLALAREVVSRHRERVLQGIPRLSPSLGDAFLRQLESFTGDDAMTKLVVETLEAMELDAPLDRIGEEQLSLVHTATVMNPDASLRTLERLLQGRSDSELQAFDNRRHVVEALHYLLWFSSTYAGALLLLYRLARNENETWGNNATGLFEESFQISLGGTSVPAMDRLDWLDRRIAEDGAPAVPLALKALRHAMQSQQSRAHYWPGGRTPIPDWRPTTRDDAEQPRLRAWTTLLALAREFAEHRAAAAEVAQRSARDLAQGGHLNDVLNGVSEVAWSTEDRARLAEALLNIIQYDDPKPEEAARISGLVETLRGKDLGERIAFAASAGPWEHTESQDEARAGDIPRFLRQLASDLIANPAALNDSIERLRVGESSTAYQIGLELGRLDEAGTIYTAIKNKRPLATALLSGYVRGRSVREPVWPEGELSTWIGDDELGEALPVVVTHLDHSDARVLLAIQAVDAGKASASSLGGFAYGGWPTERSAEVLLKLLTYLARSGQPHDIDNALAMMLYWLNNDANKVTTELTDVGLALVDMAQPLKGSSIEFHRSVVLPRLNASYEQRAKRVTDALRAARRPDSRVLTTLDDLATSKPEATTELVLSLIESAAENVGGDFWLEELKLLSRLAQKIDRKLIIAAIETRPKEAWHTFVSHIAFEQVDPLWITLLADGADAKAQAVARRSFRHPRSFLWKTGVRPLEARLELAKSLEKHDVAAVREWARILIEDLRKEIEREKLETDESRGQ